MNITSFEGTLAALEAWVADLHTTLAQINARHPGDSVVLIAPRPKDMLVTFFEDQEVKADQLPALLVEVDSAKNADLNVGLFKGSIRAVLSLADEATHVSDLRNKTARWTDALLMHCKAPSSVNGSFTRIFCKDVAFTFGKSKGNLNSLLISMELLITTSF